MTDIERVLNNHTEGISWLVKKTQELENKVEILEKQVSMLCLMSASKKDAIAAEREAFLKEVEELVNAHSRCNKYCFEGPDRDTTCHWNILQTLRARGEA